MTTIICASDVCSADADGEYQCPECVQLDIPTWFCSDACYRANFSTHQAVHERMMHRLELLKGSRPGDDAVGAWLSSLLWVVVGGLWVL